MMGKMEVCAVPLLMKMVTSNKYFALDTLTFTGTRVDEMSIEIDLDFAFDCMVTRNAILWC
jgi:hypothetical protein